MTGLVITAGTLFFLMLGVLWGVRFFLLSRPCRKWLWGHAQPNSTILTESLAVDGSSKTELAGNLEKISSYPVKYLSERSSHSLLRIVPWDASGTLSETDAGFHFVGSSRAGEPLEMQFPSEEARINYQRGSLLWDGGVSWCVIEVDGERHYFTSDLPAAEDALPQSNEVNTTVIYRNLTNRYIRDN